MNGPKARFTMVVGFLVVSFWLYLIVSTYLFGERGLNFARYGQGVILLSASTLAGFAIVWLALKGMEWAVNRQKTGFEGSYTDEYGTTFRMIDSNGKPGLFALSLSRFLPLTIAPPTNWPGLHPLEAELIGFLNGYRHWPYDLSRQDISLHDHAMQMWDAVRCMEGATWIHRVAALSQDLGKTYSIRENRDIYPLRQWWKRDRVRFDRRSVEHGGMAGVILSTMPSFRNLGDSPEDSRRLGRALLTALKHRHNPMSLPINADPMARNIIEVLHRAMAEVKKKRGEQTAITPDAGIQKDIVRQLKSYMPALLDEVTIGTDGTQRDIEAVRLGEHTLAIKQRFLLGRIAQLLTPAQREALHLWESGGGANHPAWPLLAKVLQELGVLLDSWDGVPAHNGTVQLVFGHTVWEHGCLLRFDPETYTGLVQRLQSEPLTTTPAFAVADANQVTAHVKEKAAMLDEQMRAAMG